jgi:hypothetical protein
LLVGVGGLRIFPSISVLLTFLIRDKSRAPVFMRRLEEFCRAPNHTLPARSSLDWPDLRRYPLTVFPLVPAPERSEAGRRSMLPRHSCVRDLRQSRRLEIVNPDESGL